MWELVKSELLTFLIGTIFLGGIFEGVRRLINYCLTTNYRGWELVVTPRDDRDEYRSDLLWEEIAAISKSKFDNRKFVQSVCTSEGIRIKAGQIDVSKPDSWAHMNSDEKKFYINFKIIPDEILLKKG